MKKINYMFVSSTHISRIAFFSILIFVCSLWFSKPVHAEMYKYIKKDGSTLLTSKRLRSSKYRLVKVYKIKKRKAYKSSVSRKKRSSKKKSSRKNKYRKNKKYAKRSKKRKSKSKKGNKRRYAKNSRKKKTSKQRRRNRNALKNLVKANGRDNGIITGCNSYKHLSRQSKIYQKPIEIYSRIYNVEAELIHAIVRQESCFNEGAHSRVGAIGLMQLMPGTALGLRINDPWNPEHNIQGGIKYIAQMLKTFDGNPKLAIAAYNAGPGNVRKYKGIPPFKETQNYVKKVYGEYLRLKREGINYNKKLQVALK